MNRIRILVAIAVFTAACVAKPAAQTVEIFGREGPSASLVKAVVGAFNCAHPETPIRVNTFPEGEPDSEVAVHVSTHPDSIGFLGRYLKTVERDLAREELVNLQGGVVSVVVPASSARKNLEIADFALMLAGKLPDVTTVVTVARTPARDLVDRTIANSGRGDAVRDVATAPEALAFLGQHQDAAAVVPFDATRDLPASARPLTIVGVAPSVAAAQDGSYQLRVFFNVLVPNSGLTTTAASFLSFARSDAGAQAAFASYGGTPTTSPCR